MYIETERLIMMRIREILSLPMVTVIPVENILKIEGRGIQ